MDPRSWNDDTPPLGSQQQRPTRRPYPQQPYPPANAYPAVRGDEWAYENGPEPERPAGRRRAIIASVAVVALLVVFGTVGWLLFGPDKAPAGNTIADPSTGGGVSALDPPSATASAPATSAKPTPTATKPKPKPSPTKAKPRPTPSKKPPKSQLPPPPPKPSPKPGCPFDTPASDVSRSTASTALGSAGARDYWTGVQPPDGAGDLSTISVPALLMDAFAWTESSWKSTAVGCDGAIGLMQVLTPNAAFVNQRFGESFDIHSTNGNCQLGAAYIEWLTVYFGLYYFGSYDLMNATANVGPNDSSISLLDVVIAAYNAGPAAIENDNGTPNDGSDDTLSIPNQAYVDKVQANYAGTPWAFMTS